MPGHATTHGDPTRRGLARGHVERYNTDRADALQRGLAKKSARDPSQRAVDLDVPAEGAARHLGYCGQLRFNDVIDTPGSGGPRWNNTSLKGVFS